MNKIFSSLLPGDHIIRIFLAVFCPPLAVADKGCLLFVPIFLLYLFQVTALGLIFVFSFYAMWWLFFECPLLLQLYGNFELFYRQLIAQNPNWIASNAWNTLCLIGCNVILLATIFLIYLLGNFVFGLLSSAVNIVFGFIPILTALIVCVDSSEQATLKPGQLLNEVRRHGIFSMQDIRHFFLGANRIALCFIYPPLAVADMGGKKMLLVFLFNLLGWFPGVAAVLFCVIKKYSSNAYSENPQ